MVYSVPASDLDALQSYCREELTGVPVERRSLSLSARREMLGRLGEAAAFALIRHHLPNVMLTNANEARGNQPGYDLLANGKHRIQVKGRCWVELIDFSAAPLSSRVSWNNDLWIMVDFGPLVDGRHGRLFGNDDVRPRGQIDYYVAPTSDLRDLVARKFGARFEGRVKLWAGKTDAYRRNRHHTKELFQYRNAVHHLNSLES